MVMRFRAVVGYLTPLGGTLYFKADDGAHGDELWKSDGTRSGTAMVEDIDPGDVGSQLWNFTVLGDALCFFAFIGDVGQLWKIRRHGGGYGAGRERLRRPASLAFRWGDPVLPSLGRHAWE